MVYIDIECVLNVNQYGKIFTRKKKPLIKENLDTDSVGSNIGVFLPEIISQVFNNPILSHKTTAERDDERYKKMLS